MRLYPVRVAFDDNDEETCGFQKPGGKFTFVCIFERRGEENIGTGGIFLLQYFIVIPRLRFQRN